MGILNARDLLLDMASSRHRTVRELMHPAYLVPETLSADDLFRDMQHKKVHLAVVIDEYGELAGVVSLEDLLEEIVGNIYDEFDPAEPPELEHLEDGVWRCSGGLSVDTLAEELGFDPPEDADYDTVGGMVLSCLRTIPEDGSRPHVEAGGLDLQVEQVADHRIQWVLVRRSQPAAPHPQ
ncbi:transporter associated domain-containing protein [Clostridium phoceensis]|uniref:transporter associated domain-containing protein n=1 Tax=Clostridium phoceensis TaxID=1650661 RepID=UPI000AC65AED|nr:transporter associated domain-containing protein [Clostridium phoceensis]